MVERRQASAPEAEGRRKPPSPWRALCAACVQVVDYASAGVPLPSFVCRKRAVKRVCSPDERSEIRERHKSSLIVPGYRSAHPGYRLRAVSTSLFDITRARSALARTGSYGIPLPAARGEGEGAQRTRVEGASLDASLSSRTIRRLDAAATRPRRRVPAVPPSPLRGAGRKWRSLFDM